MSIICMNGVLAVSRMGSWHGVMSMDTRFYEWTASPKDKLTSRRGAKKLEAVLEDNRDQKLYDNQIGVHQAPVCMRAERNKSLTVGISRLKDYCATHVMHFVCLK